jgi:hypothetical protein
VSSGYAGAIDLVIFDNDGVVVDSELLANRVLSDLLTECGHPTSLEECIREYMGGTLAGVRSSVRRQWGDELPDAFDDLYHDRLFDAFSTDLRPVRGIEQVLSELDLPYCLASSGTFERINRWPTGSRHRTCFSTWPRRWRSRSRGASSSRTVRTGFLRPAPREWPSSDIRRSPRPTGYAMPRSRSTKWSSYPVSSGNSPENRPADGFPDGGSGAHLAYVPSLLAW